MAPKDLHYDQVERFLHVKISGEVEDEILAVYAKHSIDHDMNTDDLESYFEELQFQSQWHKLIEPKSLVIEGTSIIDLDKLLQATYYLLIFMDNEQTIDQLWGLMVNASGRASAFPNVALKNHVLGVKDLEKAINFAGLEETNDIGEMMNCASGGQRAYMTYIDFAYILGKLGFLRF